VIRQYRLLRASSDSTPSKQQTSMRWRGLHDAFAWICNGCDGRRQVGHGAPPLESSRVHLQQQRRRQRQPESTNATPWAIVAIDCRSIGETPREVRIAEGTYLVRLSHPQLAGTETTVKVTAGKREIFNATLHK
jgi:hypothetical protein